MGRDECNARPKECSWNSGCLDGGGGIQETECFVRCDAMDSLCDQDRGGSPSGTEVDATPVAAPTTTSPTIHPQQPTSDEGGGGMAIGGGDDGGEQQQQGVCSNRLTACGLLGPSSCISADHCVYDSECSLIAGQTLCTEKCKFADGIPTCRCLLTEKLCNLFSSQCQWLRGVPPPEGDRTQEGEPGASSSSACDDDEKSGNGARTGDDGEPLDKGQSSANPILSSSIFSGPRTAVSLLVVVSYIRLLC